MKSHFQIIKELVCNVKIEDRHIVSDEEAKKINEIMNIGEMSKNDLHNFRDFFVFFITSHIEENKRQLFETKDADVVKLNKRLDEFEFLVSAVTTIVDIEISKK